jgi:hypothetical protein
LRQPALCQPFLTEFTGEYLCVSRSVTSFGFVCLFLPLIVNVCSRRLSIRFDYIAGRFLCLITNFISHVFFKDLPDFIAFNLLPLIYFKVERRALGLV